METKIIPFDLETAKKIQAGEIEGSIKTKNGLTCKIVSYCNGTDFFVERKTESSLFLWCFPYAKDGRYIDGKNNGGTDYDLVLEVFEEASEHKFKPFDKVLVRDSDNEEWLCAIFSHISYIQSRLYVRSTNGYNLQCIPYEGNEHLAGTTDKPKEE